MTSTWDMVAGRSLDRNDVGYIVLSYYFRKLKVYNQESNMRFELKSSISQDVFHEKNDGEELMDPREAVQKQAVWLTV